MPPVSLAAVRGVEEKPPVPVGIDEVVVVTVVGAVVGAVVVVLSGGGADGCGATQAVTTARPAPTRAAEAGPYQRGACAESDVTSPDQPSLKTASSRMELFPASPAWPRNGVTPSICSMPLRVE